MDSLFTVAPAYNEEDNIEAAVKEGHSCLKVKSNNSFIAVADCGSTDKPYEILTKMQVEYL